MNHEVFITCALTGAGATTHKSDFVPITPGQIAESAIASAKAGAAIVHIHVRDPETGVPARDPALYKGVVDRIRASDVDVVLNLTAGMGGDLVLGPPEQPLPLNMEQTDMAGAKERLAHVAELRPEICTLDCGTMNFAEGNYVMTNTPSMLRAMAKGIKELGVRPEIEVFDTGHLVFAKQLIKEGLLDEPAMFQLCMGIPYGAPDDPDMRSTPPLARARFLRVWQGRSLATLFEFTRATMPEDNPDSMTEQEYVDVIAYMLILGDEEVV
jgi:uncharacterized protein (DUF849 family)